MKPLVIYHASCADGFGAAFAAWLKLGDEAEYVPCQYGQVNTDNNFIDQFGWIDGREVYILDFSFPREVMDQIFRRAKRATWCDHHKTAFEMWCCGIPDKGWLSELRNCTPDNPRGTIEIHLNNNKSGAMLAWEYFHPGTEVPMFIRHIDDYDRWQFKLEGTKAFQKALWSYAPWSFEQWNYWFGDGAPEYIPPIDFCTEGEAILRAHEQNVQSVVKGGARKCEIQYDVNAEITDRFNGLAANCPPHLQSDVGHELAVQSGTFGLLWSLDKDNVCKCSLRSNGDYDVSAIAKAFGGGGHRNAAGFSIDIQTLLGWIK